MKIQSVIGLCAGAAIFCASPVAAFADTQSTQPASQKTIVLNRQTISRPYGTVHSGTTYMPIWYLMNALEKLGVQANWNGQNLYLTGVNGTSPDLSQVNPGSGSMAIYLDGTLVQKVDGSTEIDPAANQSTTYMPLWYLMQTLDRMHVSSNWDGVTWNLTSPGSSATTSATGSYSVVATMMSTRSRANSSTNSSDSSSTPSASSSNASSSALNRDIVNYAKQFIGTPYVYGGTSANGFDCSGYVKTVFAHYNIDLPRTAAEQAQVGQVISKSDLQPGDLVFFNTTGAEFSHVGIYVGDGQFISATTSKGVRICKVDDPYYWGSRFTRSTNPQG